MLADGLVLSRNQRLATHNASRTYRKQMHGGVHEEEELRSASSPFLFKSPRRNRPDLGSQLIHKNPETSSSIVFLFICRITFHPAMVARVSQPL
jgi:hypothetical protein